jgi:hypothetical protein
MAEEQIDNNAKFEKVVVENDETMGKNAEHIPPQPEATAEATVSISLDETTVNEEIQDIDLSEIDAYLKTLVPGVLKLSENLVTIGEKFKKISASFEDRLSDIDNHFKRYDALFIKKNKLIQMTLIGSIGAVFLSLTMMFIAGYNYSNQVTNMNALSISLAKRLSEVNSGLVTFEQLYQSISSVNESIERLQLLSENQSDSINDGVTDLASQISATSSNIDASLSQWETLTSNYSNAIKEQQASTLNRMVALTEQLIASQNGLLDSTPTLNELVGLKNEINALIVLERNNFMEAISASQKETQEDVNMEIPEPPAPLQYKRETNENEKLQ